jgi:colanic acid/amylovoran biosynthesis protein
MYLPFLSRCIHYLFENGAKPFILIHEGKEDRTIGEEIVRMTGKRINIIQEKNPLFIKGIIGTTKGVISSRFHGIVSALAQGVPALGTGWSHKYEMLFREYGFPEGLIKVNDSSEILKMKIDLLLSDKKHQAIKEKLLITDRELKIKSLNMWSDVFRIIKR